MVENDIKFNGELPSTAKHIQSGAVIETDAPVDNQGKGEAFSPTDLCASSLGVCMLTILGIVGKNNDIDLGEVKGKVKKEMSSDLPRRISKISINFEMPLSSTHPKKDLIEDAMLNCPVHHSLHPEIEKHIVFTWQHD